MTRPPEKPVTNTITEAPARWTPLEIAQKVAAEHKHEEGYIIGFDTGKRWGPAPSIYQAAFVKLSDAVNPVVSPMGITGGALESAHVFPTYQEAVEAAASWAHTQKPSTRIIRVRRRPPIEIFEDYPTNVLDALAEL